jgi:hypothetical protein
MRLGRLIQILALFAVLFAPLGMLGNHAAMAMPQAAHSAAMDHHSEDKQMPAGHDRASIDCAMACAAMPAADPFSAAAHAQVESLPHMALHPRFRGSAPEMATPPPRLS